MRTTLVIMAAGIGSRFGQGIKQLTPVGPQGEVIMDYSLHDAFAAGFNKVVFIIRKDLKETFREIVGERIEKLCKSLDIEVDYAYQELENVPAGVQVPEGRKKPWGTGQAILACKGVVNEPFAVINADDYYGKECFGKLYDFLQDYSPEHPNRYCMAGFILKNTLSENGGVTRGVCQVNADGYLTDIVETSNIVKVGDKAAIEEDGKQTPIDENSYVSMNLWGLTPEFIDLLGDGFVEFFDKLAPEKALKAEYLLPSYIGELLEAGKVSVKVLDTQDKWFGVTYHEDKDYVVDSFAKLTEAGVYKEPLFGDLQK